MEFQYGNKTISFNVEYRNRKTMKIAIVPPKNINVVAPNFATEEEVLKAVKSKAKWITKKLFELKDIEHTKREKEYVNGESLMYLGKNYSLKIVKNNEVLAPQLKLYRGKFYMETNTLEKDVLKKSMELWYREKTLEKVLEKIKYYEPYFRSNIKVNNVRVKEQKKRWASCTSNRDLLFNWRCSMAPSDVLDYIVVHEMCHMIHMNHSRQFWNEVENIMPAYKDRREWLKQYGIKMNL